MPDQIRPVPVDEVTITILVDNVFDVLMSGTGPVERWPLPADVFRRELPVAEHGFAALVEVAEGGRRRRILFDAGVSPTEVGLPAPALSDRDRARARDRRRLPPERRAERAAYSGDGRRPGRIHA